MNSTRLVVAANKAKSVVPQQVLSQGFVGGVRSTRFHLEAYNSGRYLPPQLLDSAMKLLACNMREHYMKSESGWSESAKRKELIHRDAHFIFAFEPSTSKMVSFVHYRFLMEDTAVDDVQVPVIYCYEIQIDESAQRIGLGSYLMTVLEEIGRAWKMKKIMLTVFKHNQEAVSFYKSKLGFMKDEISPDDTTYEILFKNL